MRPLRTFLLLALAAALLAPLAAADQERALGPATAKTQSTTTGEGCDGANGSESRYAEARVRLTANESLFLTYVQSCTRYDWTQDDGHGGESYARGASDNGGVHAGRDSRGNPGPVVHYTYSDIREESTWGAYESCGSQLYASGPVLFLGCWPDGGRWPMLPALP